MAELRIHDYQETGASDASVELFGAVTGPSANARRQMHMNLFLGIPEHWPRAA